MCIASKYANELNCLLTNLIQDKKRLSEYQSKLDQEVSKHYHKIETAKFNAAEGFYLAKDLQTLLRKRRVVKQELRKIDSLIATMQLQSFNDRVKNATKRLKAIHKDSNKYMDGWEVDLSDVLAQY